MSQPRRRNPPWVAAEWPLKCPHMSGAEMVRKWPCLADLSDNHSDLRV